MKLILAWIWNLDLVLDFRYVMKLVIALDLDFGCVMNLVFGLNLDFIYDMEILLDLNLDLGFGFRFERLFRIFMKLCFVFEAFVCLINTFKEVN